MSRDRPDPEEFSPGEAAERYLRRRDPDSTEASIDSWYYRLKLFVEWCESVGIHQVGELRGYDADEYYELRNSQVEPSTLEGEMYTLKKFFEFLEDLGAVDDGLADSVRIPDLDADTRSSDKKLADDDARALLEYYRTDEDAYGTRAHAYLELAWHTGARSGGLRALDVRDVYLQDDPYVEFVHRPTQGTPLKNKRSGYRPVAISDEITDVLRTYLQQNRYDVHDTAGRQPFLASAQGRPTGNSLRVWSYLATLPCQYGPCPHGKDPEACEWTQRNHASKCPSSRAPHHVRTGAITWMLNQGWMPEDVAERVNATVSTIEDHYDKADPDQRRRRLLDRMDRRRRPMLDRLDFADSDHDSDNAHA